MCLHTLVSQPLPAGPCHDSNEWRCPGWDLCGATNDVCTHTHCCADTRDVCYQKHPFYAQCMRRGTCVPGGSATCTELHSELGQCSAAYKDCHLSACCQRGEDRCFLKNDGYGKCMPSCNPNGEQRDWQCRKHELPSEKHKLSCRSLRGRTNLFSRLCATQYQGPGQCNAAYTSSNNVYRPCVWDPMKLLCEESSQSLACDCELYHRGCPHAASHGGAHAHGSRAAARGRA